MSENKQERIVILSKGFGIRFEKNFFMAIQEGFDNGYRIADTDRRDDVSMRNFQGRQGRAVMYLEGCEPSRFIPATVEVSAPVTETPTVREVTAPEDLSTGRAENAPVEPKGVEGSQWDRFEELNKAYAVAKEASPLGMLEKLSKYKELKEFAKNSNIEVPANLRNPAAIKKVIQDTLEAK